MRVRYLTALMAASAVLVWMAGMAVADKPSTVLKKERMEHHMASSGKSANFARLNDLIGLKVENRQNEDLGKISDLVLDLKKGTIKYGVVSYGGVMGVGEKLVAVPFHLLMLDHAAAGLKHQFVLLDISKQGFENAPSFESGKWPDMTDSVWASNLDKYFAKASLAGRAPTERR